MPLMRQDSGELKGKRWLKRGEWDQQMTLRRESNSSRRERSCNVYQRTNHKAIGADHCLVLTS